MQGLVQENARLKAGVEGVLEAIEEQKEMNQKHESEIETLLKFN